MQEQFLILQQQVWWLFPEVLLAAGLSWLLYSKKNRPWSTQMNWILGGLRFCSIFLLLFLLLQPFMKFTVITEHPPIVAIAVDNSISIADKADTAAILKNLNQLSQELTAVGNEVVTYDLSGPRQIDELLFDHPESNLNLQLEKILKQYEGRNLAAIIQLSDGIYNRGYSPAYASSLIPVYTIGVGDTLSPKDNAIIQVKSNKVVYQGNKFNVDILITSNGFSSQSLNVRVEKSGKIQDQQQISMKDQNVVTLTIDADEAGLYRYTAFIDHLQGDDATANDQYDFYVDVVEGKENILIVASGPHPDIRAIRAALAKSENYRTFLFIPDLTKFDETNSYDVVIYHNAFDRRSRLPKLELPTAAKFYMVSANLDPSLLTDEAKISLIEYTNQKDNVIPGLAASFSKFTLALDAEDILATYPSITTPFAETKMNGPHETLLYQKVGNEQTSRSLLSFYDDGSAKFAVLMGTGIWKWRLQESAINEESKVFDQLMSRTIQYLSVRNDKRKFRTEPINRIYEQGSTVIFRAEVYNEIYEQISQIPIQISIADEQNVERQFDFVSDKSNNQFDLNTL
ncbi:MAG: hypothetical protein ACI9RP_003061, partial [Cyclobacteriaceae bacterium]